MSIIKSMSMFYLSFLPLWVAILFIDINSICENNPNLMTEKISIVVIVSVFVGALLCLRSILCSKKRHIKKYYVLSAKEEKNVTFELLLTYVLPLFAFDFTQWKEVVLFLIFFLFLGFLCIKHKLFYVNILMEIMNYRYYACTLEIENVSIEKIVISKDVLSLKLNDTIEAYSINNDYMIGIKKKDEKKKDQ